jgi:DMSO/TMAO reductase YedYZ molybdopterin-dependent catalytic subunit
MDDDAVTTTTTTPAPAVDSAPPVVATRRFTDGQAALAGVVATIAALGISELAAGLLGAMSPIAAIGGFVIDHQPPGAKDFVVSIFGTNDKLALEMLIVAVSLVVGAVLGALARRRFAIGAIGIGAFAIAGFLASLGDPTASAAPQAIVAGVGAFVGIETLSWLLAPARLGEASLDDAEAPPARTGRMPDWSRRSFLIRSGSVAAASVVAGVAGRSMLESAGAAPSTGGATIPPAAEPASLPAGASLNVPDITPIVMPNDRFYRIDTSLIAPNVDVASWRLTVKGMVDRETTLAYADLVELPIIEQYVTIACVSNEVGGQLVGNAKWTGVRLRDVLEMAGVQAGATQLVGRSVDGWTAGMPTEWVMDPAREPMIALKMNDEVLPKVHGFPARLIVPGLYGYVSATKWLAELELTTLEAFDGYWVPLGWAKEAPILTQSRIDVPRRGEPVPAGRVAIAGVAWAPDRGISKVEVAIDGEWRPCLLSTPISNATWVQWQYAWDAAAAGAGPHTIEVRATDGTGTVQTDQMTAPAPDGARGHDQMTVMVVD